MKRLKSKKAQLIVFDIVMYLAILILLIITFVFIATFTPSDFKEKDFDQRSFNIAAQMDSALSFKVENKTLYYWVNEGELTPDRYTPVYLNYRSLFIKTDLCGLTLEKKDEFVTKINKDHILGKSECESILRAIINGVSKDAKLKASYEIGESIIYIVPLNTRNTNILLGTWFKKREGES